MKKIVKLMITMCLMICILVSNQNICYADSINLNSYTNRIIKNGKLNETYTSSESEINKKKDYWHFTRESGLFKFAFGVHYEWLEAAYEMAKLINSDKVTYKDIAKNSVTDIKNAISALKRAQNNIGTFEADGEDVDDGEDLISEVLNEDRQNVAKRSKTAFKKITGYEANKSGRNDFDNYLGKAIRELNSARDLTQSSNYKTEDGDSISIKDDYKTKFKYTYKQIELYRNKVYGNRYNCENSDIVAKVWDYKSGLYKADSNNSLIKRKDLYVDKNDSRLTKQSYDADKLAIYKIAFGDSEYQKMIKDRHIGASYEKLAQMEKDEKSILSQNEINKIIEDGQNYSKEHENDFNEKYSNDEFDADMIDAMSESRVDSDKDTVFSMPKNTTTVASNGPSDVVNDADAFLNDENATTYLKTENLQSFSQNLYSLLLGIGIVLSVIIGMILGIKIMLAPIGQKAEAKKLLIPYIVGCVVVFGAFGIWRIMVIIMQGL